MTRMIKQDGATKTISKSLSKRFGRYIENFRIFFNSLRNFVEDAYIWSSI